MTTQPVPAPLKIYPARASSIIVHHVPADATAAFLQWERTITFTAAAFPGYQITEAYPPGNPALEEWVVLMHFDNSASLEAWLKSSQRASCMAQLPAAASQFQARDLSSGLGEILLRPPTSDHKLPHWKAFLTVLVALYPIVMLLNLLLAPHLNPLGLPLAMLIANALSVSILEYLVMPSLGKLISPWLEATGPTHRTLNLTGAILIIAALTVMTYGFSFLY